MATSTTRRPTGATLIALILLLQSVGALGVLIVLNSTNNAMLFPPFSPAARLVHALHSLSYTTIVLWYAISASLACAGIWGMRSWKATAFLVWSAAAVSWCGFFIWAAPSELILGGKLAALPFVLCVAVLLGLIYRYLRHTGKPHAAL